MEEKHSTDKNNPLVTKQRKMQKEESLRMVYRRLNKNKLNENYEVLLPIQKSRLTSVNH